MIGIWCPRGGGTAITAGQQIHAQLTGNFVPRIRESRTDYQGKSDVETDTKTQQTFKA